MNKFLNRLYTPDVASLFLRIAIGIVFIHAGWLKLSMMDFVVSGFVTTGLPAFLAYVVTYVELIGGIVILLGLFTRCAATCIAIIMLGAFYFAHMANGFGLQNNGYEYVFVLFFVAFALISLGSGKYSLARLVKRG